MFVSGGAITSGVVWAGNIHEWPGNLTTRRTMSYAELYRTQLWVAVCVNKLSGAAARLPLKVYERRDGGREDGRDSAYARLLARPNRRMTTTDFVGYVFASYYLYGEALIVKTRDELGRPDALYPISPTAFTVKMIGGRATYTVWGDSGRIEGIDEADVIHWRTYNPDDQLRGLSVLEPLRATLEVEDYARRASSALWRNGARPNVVLKTAGQLSDGAANRLRVQWEDVATGVERTGATVILEEGLTPETLTIPNTEAQYVESRKLNRDEIVAAYDVPPTAVGILEYATLSNVTELNRSLYRDTMAATLAAFEAVLAMQLRGSTRRGASEPDYGDELYAEFLLDDVLRGDWEARTSSYQRGITSGWLTPNEVRRLENMPPIEGGDRAYIQGAMVPLQNAGVFTGQGETAPETDPAKRLATAVGFGLLTPAEAKSLLTYTPPVVIEQAPEASPAADNPLTQLDVRTIMGRLSRVGDLATVSLASLTVGLTPEAAGVVERALDQAVADGLTVQEYKAAIKTLGGTA